MGCKLGKFQCKSGECIEAALVCDGTPSCADGSDEREEGEATITNAGPTPTLSSKGCSL